MAQRTIKPILNALISKRFNSCLTQAIKDAEGVVGYSSSFLNLRWLLTDEFANLALQIRKLVGTNHPLLDTARTLILGNGLPNWGLIVLLMSKAAGLNDKENEIDKDRTAGILNSQRVIAEVTEMIRTSHIIHKSMVNINHSDLMTDLNFGNKVALLSGDYLLSKSYKELAYIYNQDVALVMSSTLRDLVESQFISNKPYKPISTQNVNIQHILNCDPLESNIVCGSPRNEWIYRSIIGGASLLAKACRSTIKLGKHPESIQQLGYICGINIALAWQIQAEREAFSSNSPKRNFSLVSAPVMLHLEEDHSIFDLIDSEDVDYSELRKRISLGNSLDATRVLQNEFCQNALNALQVLPESSAQIALENIIKTMYK